MNQLRSIYKSDKCITAHNKTQFIQSAWLQNTLPLRTAWAQLRGTQCNPNNTDKHSHIQASCTSACQHRLANNVPSQTEKRQHYAVKGVNKYSGVKRIDEAMMASITGKQCSPASTEHRHQWCRRKSWISDWNTKFYHARGPVIGPLLQWSWSWACWIWQGTEASPVLDVQKPF